MLFATLYRDPKLARWLALFVALNIGDLVTTYIVLRLGGYEANPLFAGLFARFGFIGGSVVKLAGVAIMVANMVIAYPGSPKWAHREAVAFCVVMAVVVAFNLSGVANYFAHLH